MPQTNQADLICMIKQMTLVFNSTQDTSTVYCNVIWWYMRNINTKEGNSKQCETLT